ncbi:hypothetical protein ACOMHN_034593 [Nucella lapillus]
MDTEKTTEDSQPEEQTQEKREVSEAAPEESSNKRKASDDDDASENDQPVKNSKAIAKGQPGYDALYKVRPLLDLVFNNSRAHYYPGQDVSVDKAMIKFNGKLSFKQYIKGKPSPCRFKVWCAADPRTGYMLEFDVYLGRALQPMPHGLGYHVVTKLGERFLKKGHHLYFDNYSPRTLRKWTPAALLPFA